MDYVFQDTSDICTDLQIVIFLRPLPTVLDRFQIQTDILNIWCNYALVWQINNLITHTSHSNFDIETNLWNDVLIAHNVSVSSIDGEIYGRWVVVDTLELCNEHGIIFIWLGNKLSTDLLFPESICLSSNSADIVAISPIEAWPPQFYTHRTRVETVSGTVKVQVPHGCHTNFSSISGNMLLYLRLYSAVSPDIVSEIYITSQSGNINMYLLKLDQESLARKNNPLLNTFSEHKVGEGKL